MLFSKDSSLLLKTSIQNNDTTYCSGLLLSARWAVLASMELGRLNLIILPERESAEYCASDLYEFIEGDRVFFLCDSSFNVQRSNFKATSHVQRTSAISKIVSCRKNEDLYIVTYPEALEEGVPPSGRIRKPVLKLSCENEYPFSQIASSLVEAGFEKVDFVSEPGQFSVRGGIIDVFSYDFNHPYRISFFGNEVEKITVFDANTQLSIENREKVDIVSDLSSASEDEYKNSLFDILPSETLVWMDSSDMYSEKAFFCRTSEFKRIFLDTPLESQENDVVKFNIAAQPVFNKNFDLLTEDIRQRYLQGYKVYIYTEKRQQVEKLKAIFMENGGIVPEFIEGKNIHEGFIDNDDKICCYSDHEIFDRFHRVNLRRSVDKTEQLTVNDLASFNRGDYIVHIDLGIGVFDGLVRIKDDKGKLHEVVKIIFKDGDTVYISVHSLHKISKYRSKDGEAPKITKLGSKSWTALRTGTKSKVKDIAKELIQLYAKRKAQKGFAFSADSFLQTELETSFEWEDTPDQEKANEAIKRDMEDSCPMDRLICGDVGFGKTELAVRAAFKAVCDGKQVAVLVPTTILCLQHYKTFSARLKNFPCRVDFISRLRTPKESSEIKEDLRNGKIDIIISTHKILAKDIAFKDLGLLIIDEEQKFGVAAKERLRELKLSVDTLTLTATPIPRTLQFSLLGARDLSIINTPPPNRVPVQTEIMLFNKDEIKSIINYELGRGGQIFFVHNNVEELDGIKEILQRLVPQMSICVAHGQMDSKTIETHILDFMAGEYDMLLCTTIIENGLDIPNANTIIINQAQNIGLSDLHQLRGRVGRSKVRGFCYLIVPPLLSISDDARKRLKAIEAFSDLGSGFNIAMQDLDIRGAGNLLGAQQSGFIAEMGLETYQKILSEAMEELGVDAYGEGNAVHNDAFVTDCAIETDIVAYIPDSYIDVQVEKIRIYKELDNMSDDKSMMRLRSSLEDRFGAIPEELDALFDIVRIRRLGKMLGFEKIILKNGIMICFFINNSMSSYYRSRRFETILEHLNENQGLFELRQKENGLRLLAKGIDTSLKAYSALEKLL